MAGLGPAFLIPAIDEAGSPDKAQRNPGPSQQNGYPGLRSLHPGCDRRDYFSARASLAPSAANPAAKLRRSQAITFGRVITRSRSEAANRP
jgi:hypothetical protein